MESLLIKLFVQAVQSHLDNPNRVSDYAIPVLNEEDIYQLTYLYLQQGQSVWNVAQLRFHCWIINIVLVEDIEIPTAYQKYLKYLSSVVIQDIRIKIEQLLKNQKD